MHKITLISIAVLFISSCAVQKKEREGKYFTPAISLENRIEKVSAKNLTNSGFFIRKGKIITRSSDARFNLFFTMRFNTQGKYLISIRSRTGIEAFRVYIDGDSVLINDRLNRNVLYGNTRDFAKITGLPVNLLKISFGDFFFNRPSTKDGTDCSKGEILLNDYYLGLTVNSKIDCSRDKVKSIIVSTGEPDKFISVDYSRFRDDNYSVPGRVRINDPLRKVGITLTIDKYMAPWSGDIEFEPGEGYKLKPIK